MKTSHSPIVSIEELLELRHKDDLIIVDASGGKDAKGNYEKHHLDGALFVDLNNQLADIKSDASVGGRHPLPTVERFAETLTNLGIAEGSHVVVYDDKHGTNAAARFWWMLRAIGHQKVQVLDGGLLAAERGGFPINSYKAIAKKALPYSPVENWRWPQADINEVGIAVQDTNYKVVDVRDADRFNGLTEPLDLIAGHIPGAINVPYSNNLRNDGLHKSPTELRELYTGVFAGKPANRIIVHCGSGVTACHTLLSIAHAGMEVPKLYVGSWSEWSRNNN